MNDELDKIDILRSRFKVSYEDARSALNAADGDVIGALVSMEKLPRPLVCTDFVSLGVDVADEVQHLLAAGPIKKLRVKYADKVLTEKAVALTVAATLVVGIAAIFINKLMIEFDRGEEVGN